MIQYLLRAISEFPASNGLAAADLDGNGGIDSLDYVLLKEYLLGKRTQFPVEM